MAGFGLINMNGRLYDPYLQRFLSPDMVVQQPDNAQNYNRYTYCLNNPLMYSDPTGWQYLAAIEKYINPFYYSLIDAQKRGGNSSVVGSGIGDLWGALQEARRNGCYAGIGQVIDALDKPNDGHVTLEDIYDYYSYSSLDGGKTWTRGDLLFSKTFTTTINVPATQRDIINNLIKQYDLDSKVKGLYTINIDTNDNGVYMTTKGFIKKNAKQTINIPIGAFNANTNAILGMLIHEFRHVYQKSVLEMANKDEREFDAFHSQFFDRPDVPRDKESLYDYYDDAIKRYDRMSNSLQIKYESYLVDFTNWYDNYYGFN